jgi:hypothetical protein
LEGPRVGLDIVASARNHTFLPYHRQSFYWLRYQNMRKIATTHSKNRLQISEEKFIKAKVKLPLCLYVKLYVCCTWGSVLRFMHLPLHPQGKSPLYPLDRRLDGSQTMVVADRKISAPVRMKSFIHLIVMAEHTTSSTCHCVNAMILLILLHFMFDKIRNKSQYLPIVKAINNFSAL